jgi:adenylate cyclase
MAVGQRRLAAIMFTDMVGYTALTQSDEAGALAILDRHNRLLRPLFRAFHGREIKTVGDAFLVEFDSALEAAQCALEIQRTLHEQNAAAREGERIRIRIGIHVGDVVQADGDVLGDAVNIASRIEALAEPEGIIITQQAYDQVQNKLTQPLVRLPPANLKNVRLPVSVYRVIPPWEGAPTRGLPPGSPSGRHLAVLPLTNISPDPKDEYFADGLTEELIAVLSQVRDLNVIARTSVVPYKTQPKSVAQVGAELGVDTVLEGSVRKAGNRIRITLQLIDVGTQSHIWANSYNRDLDDVFAVQSDVAERTAEALRLELATPGEGPARPLPTGSGAAYDTYLHAISLTGRPNLAGVEAADRLFARATTLDPKFADAYGAWANLYVAIAGEQRPMSEAIPRARELVARALALDPNSSEAHSTLANIAFQADQDWAKAEEEFRRAIALNPSNAAAHRFFALMLLALDRIDEAEELLRRLIRLDPSGRDRWTLAWAQILDGEFDAGLAYMRAEREAAPNAPGSHIYLGLFAAACGRWEEARAMADEPVSQLDEEDRFDHALLEALVGRPEEARAIIRETEAGRSPTYTSPSHLAILFGALGEHSKALDRLEEDYRRGDRVLWLYYRGVWFDETRKDPRFSALLRRYGLPERRVRGPPGSHGSPGPR